VALARMIRMSSDVGKPPIFWVPGGRGVSLLGLRGLACQLDGYSAFGVEYRVGGQGHGFLDVPTRAAEFVRLVREQQPAGPYRLAGFCLGGLVAWEAARLLSEEGAQIEALLLINSYVPRFKRSMGSQVAHRMRRLRAVQAASGWAGVLRGLTSAMRQRVRAQTEGSDVQAGPDSAAEELNMNAMNQFRPGPLNVPTIIIGAQDTDDLRGAPLHADPRFGWLALASGPQAFELIPGDHLSVLEAPYLDRLVHAVRSRLPNPPASALGPAHDPGT
jgi:phthiocerol/phenolphthiocerol synthesis type-I polyketide synthase D